MNKRLLIALVVSLISGSFYNLQANDLKKDGLQGSVKSVRTVEYSPVDKLMTSIRTYDQGGNMVQESLKGASDELYCVTTYEPFETGKFIEYVNYDDNGNISSKESVRVNEEGEVLSMKSFDSKDVLLSYVSSHFDRQGNVVKTESFNDKNELVESKVYGYDDQARLSYIRVAPARGENYYVFYNYNGNGWMHEVKTVTVSGTVISQILNEFDVQGNKVKSTLYPSLITSAEHEITIYDSNGNVIETSFVNGENVVVHKEEYAFSTNGCKEKSAVYDLIGDMLINNYTVSYDENGNEISKVNYNDKGVPSSYIEITYEYDDHNNWIVKTEKNKENTISLVKREIQYF